MCSEESKTEITNVSALTENVKCETPVSAEQSSQLNDVVDKIVADDNEYKEAEKAKKKALREEKRRAIEERKVRKAAAKLEKQKLIADKKEKYEILKKARLAIKQKKIDLTKNNEERKESHTEAVVTPKPKRVTMRILDKHLVFECNRVIIAKLPLESFTHTFDV